jgi:hypothetical protein
MAHYLLSVHSVEGEAREPMTDGQMEQMNADGGRARARDEVD